VNAQPRAYSRLVAGVLFLFLLLSDWVILNGPLLAVRHGLLAAMALVAVPYALRHWRAVARAVLAPPLAFFAAFLAAGLVTAPFALAPASAALHTMTFAGLTLFAIAAASTVPLATTLALLRLALAVKLLASVLLGLAGPAAGPLIATLANGTLAERHVFGGLFGNSNPLGEAAAAFLLLAVCHLVEQRRQWPAGVRGRLQAAWYALTIPVSAYVMWQSLSRTAWLGLAFAGTAMGAAGLWRALTPSLSRRRRIVIILAGAPAAFLATVALMVWLNASRGIFDVTATLAERIEAPIRVGQILNTYGRPTGWEFALAKIGERPWTGYGMSATPAVYSQIPDPSKRYANNLELEAALYAGVPAALLIVLFVASSLVAAARAFFSRRPSALSAAAILLLLFIMAQADPVVFGSPYPSLLVVLTLAVHLQRSRNANHRGASAREAGPDAERPAEAGRLDDPSRI
jgi:O-antigen ligase